MGLALKHILQISLEGDILWPIVEKKVATLGTGVEIAPTGQQATMMRNRPSRQVVNSAMNARPNEMLELVKANLSYYYVYQRPVYVKIGR